MATANGVEAKTLQFVYTWNVTHLDHITGMEPGQSYDSPKFITQLNGQHYIWQIELYPNGFSEEHEGWLSMFLVLQGGSRDILEGQYAVSVITQDFEEMNPEESEKTTFKQNDGVGHDRYLVSDVKQLQRAGFLQADDTIVLQYRINLSADAFEPTKEQKKSDRPKTSAKDKELFASIESPKKAGAYDFIITSGDHGKFYCQKEILCKASDEMAKVCNPELSAENDPDKKPPEKEKPEKPGTAGSKKEEEKPGSAGSKKQVENGEKPKEEGAGDDDIQEIKLDKAPTATVREALRFIYTGSATLKNVDMREILRIAKEWDLKGLITQIEEQLVKDLKPANIVSSLLFAHDYQMAELKPKALRELYQHLSLAPRDKKDWHRLINRPRLLKEIFAGGPILVATYEGIDRPKAPPNKKPGTANSANKPVIETRKRHSRGRTASTPS